MSPEATLSDASIQVIAAMLESVEHIIPASYTAFYNEVRTRFRTERERRGFAYATVDDSIERAPVEQYVFDKPSASDEAVLFWYALGAEIADFSSLGRGVRDHVKAVWLQGDAELKKRGLKHKFFCDME